MSENESQDRPKIQRFLVRLDAGSWLVLTDACAKSHTRRSFSSHHHISGGRPPTLVCKLVVIWALPLRLSAYVAPQEGDL